MGSRRVWYEPLNLFAVSVAVAAAAAMFMGRQWRPENEIEFGPASIPLFTALFFVALATAVRTPDRALQATKRLLPSVHGGIYTGAAIGLALLGIVSTAVSSGNPFGYVFFASFVVWPVLVAAAVTSTSQSEYYARTVLAVAAVGAVAGFGLRVFPDNINLVGMMVSSAALFLMVRSPGRGATFAALLILVVLVADSRRTLGLAHAVGIAILFSDRFLRRRPGLSTLVAGAVTVCVVCMAALAASLKWINSLPGQQYLGSIADFFSDEQRLGTDGRRAELMGYGVDAIRDQPWSGVGGGRYLAYLEAIGVDPSLQVRPHNLLIFIWAELGLVGFVLAVLLLAAPIVRYSRRSNLWVVLLPPTLSMFTNDYYFSPGYFAALLLVAVAHRQEDPCQPSTSPSSWSQRTKPATFPESSIRSARPRQNIGTDQRSL